MANKIVLVSDDSNFFDYIRSKLELRKSDELFTFTFDEIPEKIHLISTAVIIINSENAEEKTLDLLRIFKGTPSIVSAYNDNDAFRRKCYREGMLDFMPLLTPDAEFRARMIPALSLATLLEKNKQYRDILVGNKILSSSNEVFLDYNYILDKELELIQSGVKKAVFAAISPNDKTKFLINPNILETTLLNNIRRNDILMTYAPNKYFLLMFDIDIEKAKKLWNKIQCQFQQKIYIGFATVSNQKREQLINETLNRLHISMSNDKGFEADKNTPNPTQGINTPYSNFKMFKQEFAKKISQIITPTFYQIQQKYTDKLAGISLQQGTGEGYGTFYIKGKYTVGCFRITSPGFSKINIDITFQKDSSNIDAKRITLEPEELEPGLLEDLLEQFITEYKRGTDNEIS